MPESHIGFVSEEMHDAALSTRNDAVPLMYRELGLLAAFADMRIVPALVDTVSSLALQKSMTERRLTVQSLHHLDEAMPPSHPLFRSFDHRWRTGQFGGGARAATPASCTVLEGPHLLSTRYIREGLARVN